MSTLEPEVLIQNCYQDDYSDSEDSNDDYKESDEEIRRILLQNISPNMDEIERCQNPLISI